MAASDHQSKMKVLCIMGAIFTLLLGLLLGISLNNNSHDVLASYRSSIETIDNSNIQLAKIMQTELDIVLQKPDTDSLMRKKVESLQKEQMDILHYCDSLYSDFREWVNGGEVSLKILHPDEVDASTYFMINQGNAMSLRYHIEGYLQNILQLVDDTDLREQLRADIDFHTQDKNLYGEPYGWEHHHFDHTMAIEVENQFNLIRQKILMSGMMVLKTINESK